MKYVKFTGDYTKLKSMGFNFQKLYASNYLQWNKGDYRVWKKGSEVTNDRYGEQFPYIVQKLLTLDMNNLPFVESRWIKGHFYMFMYIHLETNTCTFDKTDWQIGMKREVESYQDDNDDYYDNTWKKLFIGKDILEPLIELYNKGWIEIVNE